MSRALVLAIVLAACGSKKPPPDPTAICAGTSKPEGAIVVHVSDSAASGKARGLRELANRKAIDNAGALAELDRLMSTADAVAIFTAHAAEREGKLREDLEVVRAILRTITDGDWPFAAELRFPASPATAEARAANEGVATKVAELSKPLTDGSAVSAVNERAKALATALRDLATAMVGTGPNVLEAIKVSNVAHGKLNETAAALITTGASLGTHADEQSGQRFAEAVRLWTRLSVAAARLADPWPEGVPAAHAKAFVIAGPRQRVVICAAPISFAVPAAMTAALPAIKNVRDGLGRSLGLPAGPANAPSLKALATALDAALAHTPPP